MNNVSMSLIDITRRTVYRDVIAKSSTQLIDVQHLPRGMYILNVKGENVNEQIKFVLE